MCQPRSRSLDRSSESPHQPRDDRFGVHKRQLLTQHGANRDLKCVPYTRHSQTGSRPDQRAQPRVPRKVIRNLQRIGAQIENSPHPFHHQHELLIARQRHPRAELRLVRYGPHFDLARLTINLDGPAIAAFLDDFRSRRRARLQERDDRLPVKRRTIRQMQGDSAGLSSPCLRAGRQPPQFGGDNSKVVRIEWLNCRMLLKPE